MGGSATRAYNLAKGLMANGVRVTVVAGVPHYPTGDVPKSYRWKALVKEPFANMKVIKTFVPPLASKGFARRVILFISFLVSSIFPLPFIGKVDGVFASYPQVLSFFPALVYGMVHRCPVILNVDDLWPESLYDLGMLKSKMLGKFGELVAKVAYLSADAITPISPSYIETIVNKYGVEKGKVVFIPGGVDLSLFSSNSSLINRRDKFKVLYIGAFSPAYDFEQVLRAAKLLKREEEVSLVLQGGGEMMSVVANRIKELDLNNVELVDEIVPREEVAGVMMAADALLLPLSGLENVERGISSKLYEYQAAGKPIVCCSSGMPGRYVSETGSGIVVKPGDYKALAEAVLYLKENRAVAESLGASGRRYVESNMSIEKIGSQMMMLFGKVLADYKKEINMTIYVGSLKYAPIYKSHCCAFGKECEKHGYSVRYLFSREYEWMLPNEIKQKTTFIGHSVSIPSMLKDTFSLKNREEIRKIFSEDKPTHIYMHNYHILNHFIAKLAKRRGSIFIYHVHEPYVKEKKAHGGFHQYLLYLFEYFQGKLLEDTGIAIVSSNMASRLFNMKYPNFSEKKMLIPLMYEDLGGLDSGKQDREYVTFVGPPVPAKNPEKFLDVVKYSNDNNLGLKFLLISRSKIKDNMYFQRNLEVFSKERISDEEFGELIKKSIVVLTPYSRETQSSVILVSYMYGTPVVSSNVGGLPEFVNHGKTGYLINVDAPVEDWIEGINYVMKNVSRMTVNCRNYFVENFSGKNWKKYLNDLLS